MTHENETTKTEAITEVGQSDSTALVMLPCPFCGSEDLDGPHGEDYVGDHYDPYHWVDCNDCPAGMRVDGATPDNLIKAWNRRPPLSIPMID